MNLIQIHTLNPQSLQRVSECVHHPTRDQSTRVEGYWDPFCCDDYVFSLVGGGFGQETADYSFVFEGAVGFGAVEEAEVLGG